MPAALGMKEICCRLVWGLSLLSLLALPSCRQAGQPHPRVGAARVTAVRPVASGGRLEGVARIGRTPAAGVVITVSPYAGTPFLQTDASTETDVNGRFVFTNLPPGNYRVQRLVVWETSTDRHLSRTATGSHGVRARIRPGRKTEVELGGKGWMVTGRLVKGPELEGRELAYGSGDFAFLTRKEHRSDGFPGHIIVLLIEADGRFRADDVVAGEYELCVTAKTRTQGLDEADSAIVQRSVTIPPPAGDRAEDTAIDLGEFRMEAITGGKRTP